MFAPDEDENKGKEDTDEVVDDENLSSTIKLGDEDEVETKTEDKGEDKDGAGDDDAGKDKEGDTDGDKDEVPDLPELTPEQIAALAKKPEVIDAVVAERPTSLDKLLQDAISEHEENQKTEQAKAEEAASWEKALEAYRDGDKDQLADLAAKRYEKAQQTAAVTDQISEAVEQELATVIDTLYGDQIRAMKPEEIEKLDALPLPEAIKVLDKVREDAIRAERDKDLTEAEKAARNAATAADAQKDSTGMLGGGTPKEDVGDDIGALVRKGMEGALGDVEE